MKKTIVLVAGIMFTMAVSAQVNKTASPEPAAKGADQSKEMLKKEKEREAAAKNPMEIKKRKDREAVEEQTRAAQKATNPNS